MKIKIWKVLPIPLTAGVGLELGRLPPREKFGFESCWRYIFISWTLFWKIIMIALSQISKDEVSVSSEWVNDFTFWVFLLLSGRTFLTKTGKFLGGRTKTDKVISLFLEVLLRCRKKSFLGSGLKQFLLSVEIFSLERVRLEVELHSADCLGWHLGSDSEAADF